MVRDRTYGADAATRQHAGQQPLLKERLHHTLRQHSAQLLTLGADLPNMKIHKAWKPFIFRSSTSTYPSMIQKGDLRLIGLNSWLVRQGSCA